MRKLYKRLISAPEIMTMPDIPEPTSYGLTKNISIDYVKIVKNIKNFKYENKIKKYC